jgi:hypothetical protein
MGILERVADLEAELEEACMAMAFLEEKPEELWTDGERARYASWEQRAMEIDRLLVEVWSEHGGNVARFETLSGGAR